MKKNITINELVQSLKEFQKTYDGRLDEKNKEYVGKDKTYKKKTKKYIVKTVLSEDTGFTCFGGDSCNTCKNNWSPG